MAMVEKMYWMGRDIEELSREELIDVIKAMNEIEKELRGRFAERLDVIADLTKKPTTPDDRL